MDNSQTKWISLLVVLAATALWLPQLSSGLWLDEFDTFTKAKDGVWTAILRTRASTPQCSQLYNAIMAAWLSVAGTGEVALRLPSVLATGVATLFVYRIGRLLLDRETGLLAALCFVCTHDIVLAAGDARSYAFALAASTAATEAWLRFLAPTSLFPRASPGDLSNLRAGVTWAVTIALTFYFHQLFAITLIVHAAFAVFAIGSGQTQFRFRPFLHVGALALALVSAELPNFLRTFENRSLLSYSSPPSPERLVELWTLPIFAFSVLPVVLAMYAKLIPGRFQLPETPRSAQFLALSWAVIPPLVVFLVSRLTDTQLYQARYLLGCQPGLALISGSILRGFSPQRLRLAAAVCIVLTAGVLHGRTFHSLEDWRTMTAAVNRSIDDDTPVAALAGFVESSNVEWLRSPPGSPKYLFLNAPLVYHPVRGKVRLLPFGINADTREYVEELLESTLLPSTQFVVLGRGKKPRWWSTWLDGRLTNEGFDSRPLFSSTYLEARLYERRNTRR